MSDLRESAKKLRVMADAMDRMEEDLRLPTQEVDIPGSFRKLRAALGNDVHLQIRPPFIDSYSHPHKLEVDPWSVYVGNACPKGHGRHNGVTLADAVNAAIAACSPEKEGDANTEIAAIANACDGYSGAEIEQGIVSSLYDAFTARRDLTTADILNSLKGSPPLSVTMAERVAALREWAADRCVPAD